MYIIGIDIGGTKIEAMLIYFGEKKNSSSILSFEYQDKDYTVKPASVIAKKRVSTERHLGYLQIIKKIAHLITDLCKESDVCSLKELTGIGLSIPGLVHPVTSLITASNTEVVSGHKMDEDLKKELNLDIPIRMENDANCFALCETLCGAGLEYYKETNIPVHKQTVVGVILGSGCGGGIITEGAKLLKGANGGAGEIGHMTLFANGHPCSCGRRGCAEQYLSGRALETLASARLSYQTENSPNALQIFELYKQMDPVALAVIKEYKKHLAFFLGSLIALIDPHYFVFGGGLSLQDIIYENLEEEIGQHTFLPKSSHRVYKHKISDAAGAIGAGLMLTDTFNHS